MEAAATPSRTRTSICRNKFRWEIRANEVKLFANGVAVLPRWPDRLGDEPHSSVVWRHSTCSLATSPTAWTRVGRCASTGTTSPSTRAWPVAPSTNPVPPTATPSRRRPAAGRPADADAHADGDTNPHADRDTGTTRRAAVAVAVAVAAAAAAAAARQHRHRTLRRPAAAAQPAGSRRWRRWRRRRRRWRRWRRWWRVRPRRPSSLRQRWPPLLRPSPRASHPPLPLRTARSASATIDSLGGSAVFELDGWTPDVAHHRRELWRPSWLAAASWHSTTPTRRFPTTLPRAASVVATRFPSGGRSSCSWGSATREVAPPLPVPSSSSGRVRRRVVARARAACRAGRSSPG